MIGGEDNTLPISVLLPLGDTVVEVDGDVGEDGGGDSAHSDDDLGTDLGEDLGKVLS